MARYGIVVDLNRCVGCMTCVINCKEENLTRPGVWWDQILQVENEAASASHTFATPACTATTRRVPKPARTRPSTGGPTGSSSWTRANAPGVGACAKACPYDVIVMTPDKEYFTGTMPPYEASRRRSSDPCPGQGIDVHALLPPDRPGPRTGLRGRCPSRAMIFGDLDDPDSPIHAKKVRIGADAGRRPVSDPRSPTCFPRAQGFHRGTGPGKPTPAGVDRARVIPS